MKCFAHRTAEQSNALRKAKEHIEAQRKHVTKHEPYTGPYLRDAAECPEMRQYIALHGSNEGADYRAQLQRLAVKLWTRDIAQRKRLERRKIQQRERERYKARLAVLWAQNDRAPARYAPARFLYALARAKAVRVGFTMPCLDETPTTTPWLDMGLPRERYNKRGEYLALTPELQALEVCRVRMLRCPSWESKRAYVNARRNVRKS